MNLPISTYRVQLHEKFNFHELEGILEYLHELGISTIYASPITQAVKGSQHGYDVTDPQQISPEIGTEEDLERIALLLKKYDMTWVQDIVPNHMAYDSGNAWLWDV
ncbi:MAG TPA: alpha-amylase family glycosyl hydrolase, partial [Puia sp.]|nr:alpha-amylase family glycosyl hydrolase [Puia sp.]